MTPLTCNATEAAKRLGISRSTFYKVLRAGVIKPYHPWKGAPRYLVKDLERLCERRRGRPREEE